MAMPSPQSTFFPSAIADMYSRGMDVSRDNPWAFAASAFPAAQRSNPGITMEQLVNQFQNFFQPQPRPRPQPSSNVPPSSLDDPTLALQALESLGQTGPDVPMSDDVSLGGRLGLMAATQSPLNVPNLVAQAAGMFAPVNPIALVVEIAKRHNAFVVNQALGKNAPGLAQGGGGDVPENDPSIGDFGVGPPAGPTGPTGSTPGIGGPTGLGEGLAGLGFGFLGPPAPAPGQLSQDVSVSGAGGPSGDDGAAAAAAAAAAGEGGNTGVGTGEGPAGESGGVSGDAYKRGGPVKGKAGRPKKVTAHGGEFVVNRAASKAARPQLEALNALIPPEALDSLVEKSRKFFDAANRR